LGAASLGRRARDIASGDRGATAESAMSIYPEMSAAEMRRQVFISEIELIEPALTGPEGARGAAAGA
jgi:hypothetical protein